jgi:MoaA/NifB/PqqE/SkfB family radical SAM enzyme
MIPGRPTYPRSFIIDVHNRCNGSCAYCPYPKVRDTLLHQRMEWAHVTRVLDDIREHAHEVRGLTLCGMAEPFLDDYVFECLEYGRGLPWYLQSNCSMLSAERVQRLEEVGFSGRIIAHFEVDMGIDFELATRNYAFARTQLGSERVVRKTLSKLTNRAGAAWSVPFLPATNCSSRRPYWQMTIGVTGRAHYCCDDMLHQLTVGDIREQSISEIWNGSEYERKISAMHEGRNPLCNSCLRAKERGIYQGSEHPQVGDQ